MKKVSRTLFLLIVLTTTLIACSNDVDKEKANQSENAESNQEEKTEATNTQENEEKEDKWGKDYLELGIGETGVINNNFTTVEITLNSVEIVEEKDGKKSSNGFFIIPNVTIKNISEDPVTGDEIFSNGEISDEPGDPGRSAEFIDGLFDGWPENIDPQQSQTGILLFDYYKSDVYSLQFGTGFETLTNEVRFVFNVGEGM